MNGVFSQQQASGSAVISGGRKARMDSALTRSHTDSSQRARSCGRNNVREKAERPRRSNSVMRLREEKARSEAEDVARREQAEAAFSEWLKRKLKMPRTPRASPSREQIETYSKEDAKQRVLNAWHSKYPRSKSRSSGLASTSINGTL